MNMRTHTTEKLLLLSLLFPLTLCADWRSEQLGFAQDICWNEDYDECNSFGFRKSDIVVFETERDGYLDYEEGYLQWFHTWYNWTGAMFGFWQGGYYFDFNPKTGAKSYYENYNPSGSVVPACEDYDGDGLLDATMYAANSGSWIIKQSTTGNIVTKQYGWGATCPIPGDYDGDGRSDLAVYDKPRGDWYFTYSSNQRTIIKNFGWSGCIPVPADYDGDGRTDLAVYCTGKGAYEGCWFVSRSSRGGSVVTKNWGWSSTIPVPADYDGDGKADIAVFDRKTGAWHILYSSGGSRVIQYGWNTVTPVPADYDFDERDDIALYDSANGTWYINYSSGGNTVRDHGWSGAVPAHPIHTIYRWFGMVWQPAKATFRNVAGTWKGKSATGQVDTTIKVYQLDDCLAGSWTWPNKDVRILDGMIEGNNVWWYDTRSDGDYWNMTLSSDGKKLTGIGYKPDGRTYKLSFKKQ